MQNKQFWIVFLFWRHKKLLFSVANFVISFLIFCFSKLKKKKKKCTFSKTFLLSSFLCHFFSSKKKKKKKL
ncbi:hypothetical protein DR095_00475 [Mycoplasma flocculare]|nr:hypothetical protein [Mesomycoplasma flocculare]